MEIEPVLTSTSDEGSSRASVGSMVTVCKLDYATQHVVFSWPATLVHRDDEGCVVRAPFLPMGTTAVSVDGVPFERGDVFTEFYYWERWFNIFHIASPNGSTKGWYCNVTRPARLTGDTLTYVDLVLDLFVHPDGRTTVLDEDEFAVVEQGLYQPEDVRGARDGLAALLERAAAGALPRPIDDPA